MPRKAAKRFCCTAQRAMRSIARHVVRRARATRDSSRRDERRRD
ncbi:hypothetical protein AKJ09_02825 [Labilithrix luteola]|uniref:Uncharacterized protein n=1 Tax=Labilithrix luteola TaxID=1391654 RepID=A0A0K1PS00_9BACT|nr:hypothetical protein AKJ09_02825 [Labilithrix luteola]